MGRRHDRSVVRVEVAQLMPDETISATPMETTLRTAAAPLIFAGAISTRAVAQLDCRRKHEVAETKEYVSQPEL